MTQQGSPTGAADRYPPAAHPAVDVVTDRAAVVLQERPVVPFTAWLADALRVSSANGRALQVVTPPGARITLPLRLALTPPQRWVVREVTGDGFYDGLTGVRLAWDGAAFGPVPDERGAGTVAAAFTHRPDGLGEQLIIDVRVRHSAADDTVVGGVVESLCETFAGGAPGGWGTAEPVTQLWNRGELTVLCRKRAPRPTTLLFGAGPATGVRRTVAGTMIVSREPAGVAESVRFFAGYPPGDEPPVGDLDDLVDRLVRDFTLVSLFAQRAAGRADLTAEPYWAGVPGPVGLAIGPETVRSIGGNRARRPPDLTARPIGGSRAPGIWYAVGDGRSPADHDRFQRLMRHLGGAGAHAGK